eukprot:354254-Chlamydomonas_euryale.AAC.1
MTTRAHDMTTRAHDMATRGHPAGCSIEPSCMLHALLPRRACVRAQGMPPHTHLTSLSSPRRPCAQQCQLPKVDARGGYACRQVVRVAARRRACIRLAGVCGLAVAERLNHALCAFELVQHGLRELELWGRELCLSTLLEDAAALGVAIPGPVRPIGPAGSDSDSDSASGSAPDSASD